jgi:hypothetical protein
MEVKSGFTFRDSDEDLYNAEGGFEAEKLQAYREYDFKTVAAYARKLAGI